jgi:hypothetical protein
VTMQSVSTFGNYCGAGHTLIGFGGDECPLCASLGRERKLHELNRRLIVLHERKNVVISEAVRRLDELRGSA